MSSGDDVVYFEHNIKQRLMNKNGRSSRLLETILGLDEKIVCLKDKETKDYW